MWEHKGCLRPVNVAAGRPRFRDVHRPSWSPQTPNPKFPTNYSPISMNRHQFYVTGDDGRRTNYRTQTTRPDLSIFYDRALTADLGNRLEQFERGLQTPSVHTTQHFGQPPVLTGHRLSGASGSNPGPLSGYTNASTGAGHAFGMMHPPTSTSHIDPHREITYHSTNPMARSYQNPPYGNFAEPTCHNLVPGFQHPSPANSIPSPLTPNYHSSPSASPPGIIWDRSTSVQSLPPIEEEELATIRNICAQYYSRNEPLPWELLKSTRKSLDGGNYIGSDDKTRCRVIGCKHESNLSAGVEHFRRKHLNLSPVPCLFCPNTYYVGNERNKHMRSAHESAFNKLSSEDRRKYKIRMEPTKTTTTSTSNGIQSLTSRFKRP